MTVVAAMSGRLRASPLKYCDVPEAAVSDWIKRTNSKDWSVIKYWLHYPRNQHPILRSHPPPRVAEEVLLLGSIAKDICQFSMGERILHQSY